MCSAGGMINMAVMPEATSAAAYSRQLKQALLHTTPEEVEARRQRHIAANEQLRADQEEARRTRAARDYLNAKKVARKRKRARIRRVLCVLGGIATVLYGLAWFAECSCFKSVI